jgi:Kef-type K+ transport system membrane component KefB
MAGASAGSARRTEGTRTLYRPRVDVDRETLLVILLVAALAPVVADLPPRIRVPVVVAELALGIVIGPDVLGLAEPDPVIDLLSQIGLALLFFLAGMEIDLERIREAPGRLAARGWGLSLAIGLVAGGALYAVGLAGTPVLIGLALTTTALGALVPIIKDAGLAEGPVGQHALAAGAAGELGPIVGLSLVMAVESGELWRTTLLLVFAALAVGTALLATRARPARIVRLVGATMHSSGQLAVRLALLLLGALFVLSGELGLDVVLGAFSAGLIAGLIARGDAAHVFHVKLEGIGYGFLIPVFFIATGLEFDLDALLGSATALALVPIFAALLVLARGAPAMLLYRRVLPGRERVALGLFSASALPLVVAITEVATETGRLGDEEAVALVGAAMLSLLVLPALATAVVRDESAPRSESHMT